MSVETTDRHAREYWGTRVGLILAMAGNAVGLGNFLRFPVQAAQNGGGTFMIPYFIAFVLLGIPLMWMEWGIGRYGGRFGHGTLPGMFDRMWRNRAAKYVGVIGIIMPLVVLTYYTVIIGWLLAFAVFSLTGGYFFPDLTVAAAATEVSAYLSSLQDIRDTSLHGGWVGFAFYAITIALITWVVSRGIRGGIEKLALFAVPTLFIMAIFLMIRVLTLPGTELGSPVEGLAFIWTPEWAALGDPTVWLAAAGQVFFTLSLGIGTLHTYASFLSKEDDITLTGLATASTNEFAEVVLGGTIAIPAAVTFFGVAGLATVAGTFDLGIVAMAVVFQSLPGPEIWGRLAGFTWFFLLFLAGITSSVALASPAMAFMQEEFGFRRTNVALGVGGLALFLGLLNVVWYEGGFLDEWDYWAGTFGLVVLAFIEIWIIRLAFGADAFWKELHSGADLLISRFFLFVMKWVTPLFVTGILVWWGWEQAIPTLLMDGVAPEEIGTRWFARLTLVALLLAGIVLIRIAWRRNPEQHAPVDRPRTVRAGGETQ